MPDPRQPGRDTEPDAVIPQDPGAKPSMADFRRHRWVFTMQFQRVAGDKLQTFLQGEVVPVKDIPEEELGRLFDRDLIAIANVQPSKPMTSAILAASSTAPPAWQQAQQPLQPMAPRFRG